MSGFPSFFSRLLRPAVAIALALTSLSVLQGCATRLIAVGDWGRTPDLHLAADTLKDVRMKVTCHRLDPRNNQVLARRYALCSELERQMLTLGAIVADPDDEAPADYTLQYVDLEAREDGGSAFTLIAGALTGWLIPYVATGTSRAEFRILDSRGVEIDRAPMTITQVKAFGWGALIGLRGDSVATQQSLMSRKFFMHAKNRMASHVRATRWSKP